jgi:DNA processing protein
MAEQNPNIIWLALAALPKIGYKTQHHFLRQWGTAKDIWQNIPVAQSQKEQAISIAVAQYKLLQQKAVNIININDNAFPNTISAHDDLPLLLFTKGSLESFSRPIVAVVGSRQATNYGSEVTQNIVQQLIAQGVVIASGLAGGIDSIAHQAAMSGGRTIAVLGYSHDHLRAVNRQIVSQLEQGKHLIVSQFPPGTPPQKFTFPSRNRLLAAISSAVVVTQANGHSGSLLTAQAAINYGKPVFAVPGSIFDSGSAGPHTLIRQGATLAVDAADIVKTLPGVIATSPAAFPLPATIQLSATEETLLQQLQSGAQHIDQLIRAGRLTPSDALAALSLLEIKQLVSALGDGVYRRI